MNLILLIVMGITWSLHFSLVKMLSNTTSSLFLMFPTLMGISLCFALLQSTKSLVTALNTLLDRNLVFFYVISGFLGYLIPIFLELYIADKIPAGLLTLIVTTTPIVTIAISLILKIEAVSLQKIIASIVGFVGTSLIFLSDSKDFSNISEKKWILLAFLVPFTYSLYNIYISKKWPIGLSPIQVALGETIVSAFLLLPLFIFSSFSNSYEILVSHANTIIALTIVTAVEVWSFFELIKRAGPVFVSFSTFVTLIGGFIFGYLFFEEHINFVTAISSLIILSSLVIMSVELKFKAQER